MNYWVKILLWPLSFIYGLITFFRNRLFDWGFLKEHRFDIHTIGVGNLSVGGAGKTPMVEYILRLLLQAEFKTATLSRGYKRKTNGYVLAGENSSAADIGDEPLLYFTKYNVTVTVDGDRVRALKNIIQLGDKAPQVVVLDDAFQHRRLRCGLNILVTDFNNLFFNDTMLPQGSLREYASGMVRADIIVISKTPDNLSAVEMRQITKDIKPLAHQKVFYSYLRYGELYSISDPTEKLHTLNDLFRYQIVSFAGIANALPMVNYLKEFAMDVKHLPFPDHYEYQPKDLEDILKYYQSLGASSKILVTTEKDLMRLMNPQVRQQALTMNIYILPIEVHFGGKEEEFNELILKYVRTNKLYHQKYSGTES